jgi:uncharacterized protein
MTSIYRDLRAFMETFPVVDTHEHLPSEQERLDQKVDFSTLFSHYCRSDIGAAGMSDQDVDRFYDMNTEVSEKWRLFAPIYAQIRNGSYARAARISMEKFYGYDDLTCEADALEVTERIRAANTPGLYGRVLKDTCNLRVSMNFQGFEVDPRYFRPVEFVTELCDIRSVANLHEVARSLEAEPAPTLDRYVDDLWSFMRRKKDAGLAGIKYHYAYMRDLYFESVTTADAERVFNRIYEESQGWRDVVLGFEEARPLQSYLVHRMVEMAGEVDLPVVFHVGIQAANHNRPDNCRPERLWSLINRFRSTTFILLHSGIPWTDEAGMLAKYFANVYLDMAWDHIISPELSERAIRTWVDMVPKNKLFGFGGDYMVVEKVFGHLEMAKGTIARAFAGMVDQKVMSVEDARRWIRAILHDNPAAVYKLDELGA